MPSGLNETVVIRPNLPPGLSFCLLKDVNYEEQVKDRIAEGES
jgi:hypothetical protein